MTVGVASSVANDVTMTTAGLWRCGDWRHVATGCAALVEHYTTSSHAPSVVDGQATSGAVPERRHDVVAARDRVEPLAQRRLRGAPTVAAGHVTAAWLVT